MRRAALFALTVMPLLAAPPWRAVVEERLPLFGHRNWIVVADSAYPLQSGPGIETIVSTDGQIETVRHLMNILNRSRHVRPVVYTDRELNSVPEEDAPGITAYRQELSGIIGQKVNRLDHEDIIRKLDEAARTFNVLIIKTNMTLPYTSVFIQLAASYWSDDAEKRLRQSVH